MSRLRPYAGPLVVLAAVLAVRLAVAASTGIVEDEAYYWVWSTRLAAGYYDHPPGIAWVIAPFAHLFGATSLGVRAGPVLVGTLAVAALLPFARDRWLLVGILAAMPLTTLGGVLATPDAPLLACWALALAAAMADRWLLVGLAVGLAGLCKYTGWGLWPLLVLGAPRRWKAMLPAMLLSLLVMAPSLAWNAAHDWVSVKFQLGHGLGGEGATSHAPPGFLGALEFVGAQAGLVSPLVFGAAVAWWVAARKSAFDGDPVDRLAWWTSLPVLAFFTLAATRAHGEPNWAAPAWIGAAVGVSRGGPRVRRAGWVGVGIGAMLSGLVLAHLYHPIVDFERDPTARLGVGRDLAQSVQAWGVEPVYTERYQEAALLRYYQGIDAYALPGVGRADQYDLWDTPWADHALFVRIARGGDTMPVDAFCAERGPSNVVSEHDVDGSTIDRWQVVEVRGCGPEARANDR